MNEQERTVALTLACLVHKQSSSFFFTMPEDQRNQRTFLHAFPPFKIKLLLDETVLSSVMFSDGLVFGV